MPMVKQGVKASIGNWRRSSIMHACLLKIQDDMQS